MVNTPTDLDWVWLRRHRRGTLAAGYDPARKNDRACLAIFDMADGRMELRMMITMENATFDAQKAVIASAISCGVTVLRIDSTGIGMDMAERLTRDYPGVVEGVHFTSRSKQMMVAGFYNALTDRKITIPARQELIAQLGAIREVVSDSGAVLYHSRANAEGHADQAWAMLLANSAARGVVAPGASRYESLSKRNNSKSGKRQLTNF